MMRRVVWGLIAAWPLLALGDAALAADVFRWQQVLESPSSNIELQSVQPLAGGGYVAVGCASPPLVGPSFDSVLFTARFGADGHLGVTTILDVDEYPGGCNGLDVVRAPGGGFWVGDSAVVYGVDAEGGMAFRTVVPDTGAHPWSLVAPSADGGVTLGSRVDHEESQDVLVSRLAPDGTVAWHQAYTRESIGLSLIPASSGGIYVLASDYDRGPEVFRVGADGRMVWETFVDRSVDLVAGLSPAQGGVLVWGTVERSPGVHDPVLIRLREGGDVAWGRVLDPRTLGRQGGGHIEVAALRPDGWLVVAERAQPGNQVAAVRLSDDGSISAVTTYGLAHGWVRQVVPSARGGYFLVGAGPDIPLARLDRDGRERWHTLVGPAVPYPVMATEAVIAAPQGGLVVAGEVDSPPMNDSFGSSFAIVVDDVRPKAWGHVYGPNLQSVSSIEPAADGGFVLGADVWGQGPGDLHTGYVAKTDAHGNTGPYVTSP